MKMLNNFTTLRGYLTKDPELTYTNGGMAICKFTMGVARPKNKDGVIISDFIRVTCFGKTAEYCSNYLKKGNHVHIGGSIQTGSFEKDGQKFYTTDVVANQVDSLERKPRTEDDEEPGYDANDTPF